MICAVACGGAATTARSRTTNNIAQEKLRQLIANLTLVCKNTVISPGDPDYAPAEPLRPGTTFRRTRFCHHNPKLQKKLEIALGFLRQNDR
jgi:hypothetical protein